MTLIADIASGHGSLADTLYLVAAILAGLAAVLAFTAQMDPPQTVSRWATPFAYAALCVIAIAWLVL